ncbi:DUF645 family protein [Vibrio cholerae]|nr:DUF645 family protein [Vibrio cholerae]
MDIPHGKFDFTKGYVIAVIWFSLSRTLNRDQLSLERFKFWQPTSQLLALDVCLCDVLHNMAFKKRAKSHC